MPWTRGSRQMTSSCQFGAEHGSPSWCSSRGMPGSPTGKRVDLASLSYIPQSSLVSLSHHICASRWRLVHWSCEKLGVWLHPSTAYNMGCFPWVLASKLFLLTMIQSGVKWSHVMSSSGTPGCRPGCYSYSCERSEIHYVLVCYSYDWTKFLLYKFIWHRWYCCRHYFATFNTYSINCHTESVILWTSGFSPWMFQARSKHSSRKLSMYQSPTRLCPLCFLHSLHCIA